MTTTTFDDLGLIEPLQAALSAQNYNHPTPIQVQAIPKVLAGRDLLGIAQTGTGKTAAFALPLLQRLSESPRPARFREPRVLVVAPTRELAIQIGEAFATYGKNIRFRQTVIYGGVGQRPQVQALNRGVEVLVATPGRLLDLMNQRHLSLKSVEYLVLDEADRMLDMGFIHDVRKIVAALPRQRQTLFFSATMPSAVAGLAGGILSDPVQVSVTPAATTVERIEQGVYFVRATDKRRLLTDVLRDQAFSRVIVFSRTKHGANRIAEHLEKASIGAEAIHGNKSQSARQRALEAFKSGRARVMVATDIAARGIDVDDVSHVINFDLPNVPEDYVHRIGRTARAGAAGVAISFCDPGERAYLRNIERLTKRALTPIGGEANADDGREERTRPDAQARPRRAPKRRRFRGRSARQAA